MTRHYYRKEDPVFNQKCEENPDFAPRARVLYTEREAEQDAYFWFQMGRNVELREAVKLVHGIEVPA